MKWIQQTILPLGLLCIIQRLAHAASFGDAQEIRCSYSQVTGCFTGEREKYSISGYCISTFPPVSIPWSAEGDYDGRAVNGQFGRIQKKIVVSGPSPYRGEFRLAMICNSHLGRTMPFDPWLQNVDATQGVCTQIQIQVTEEIAEGPRYRKDSGLTQQNDIGLKKQLVNHLVTNLPVGLAQASSPSGYLGWGNGGPDGRSLILTASPGTYRISAQVSSPKPTGWSQGVEFVVTAPNKAIQRAPKAFGQ